MLPGYDRHGRRVFVQRLSIADPSLYKPADVLKVSLMVGDVTIENATYQTEVCGAVVISDNVGLGLGHVKQFTPAWGKKISTIFQASQTTWKLPRWERATLCPPFRRSTRPCRRRSTS